MKIVYRFCDATDSLTCLSNAAQQEMSLPSDNWRLKGVRNVDVLKRAAEHMDGKTALSPFVSVATDVLALVKWGISGGLLDIIYGVDHPERRAPHIVTFQVPEISIISPDDIIAAIPEARILIGIGRSRLETELLYYGNDIKRFQTSFCENHYTNASCQAHLANEQQTQMQKQQEAEAADDLMFEQWKTKPAILSTKLIQNNPNKFKTFLATQAATLRAAGIDTTEVEELSLSTASLRVLGPTIRRFDDAILRSADITLRNAWCAASAGYRN